jgi:hypothetical protein
MPRKRKALETPPATLPPLPTHLWTSLGAVPVHLMDELPTDDATHVGHWDPRTRVVRLKASLSPTALWHTLVHIVLDDAGVRVSGRTEESICDALATYGVSYLLAAATQEK